MEFKAHRQAMAVVFDNDPDFRRVYQDNIAMLLHDYQGVGLRTNLQDHTVRNELADKIISLVFEDKR